MALLDICILLTASENYRENIDTNMYCKNDFHCNLKN